MAPAAPTAVCAPRAPSWLLGLLLWATAARTSEGQVQDATTSTTSATTTSTTMRSTTTTSTSRTTTTTTAPEQEWKVGTWTTGYWDCCKPSCSWPNKGLVTRPARTCDAVTGLTLADPAEPSVCQGGLAAMCPDHVPFVFHGNLSMGFAAAAVGGNHGLSGDTDCGRCFEIRFTRAVHPDGMWGGSHPELVGRTMVLQVNNIGYDVTGEHSFDIQIPGAGQGVFSNGCSTQFQNFSVDDFDCQNRYGGCSERSGCERLPQELRKGCEWRFDWYMWLVGKGKTNNPYVEFRRVRCPGALVEISGFAPVDDAEWPDYGEDRLF